MKTNLSSILYKYRDLNSFKYIVDILVNQRLYSGNYKNMNDPMEGHYLYNDGTLNQIVRDKIYTEKNALKFCCLSKNPDNYLMWSHYADGHRGIAFGVRIDTSKYSIKEIEYFNGLTHIDCYNEMTSKQILCRKLSFWEYENEVRVFNDNQNNNFIDVKIEEIILGIKTSKEDERLIKKLVKSIAPEIKIKKNYG